MLSRFTSIPLIVIAWFASAAAYAADPGTISFSSATHSVTEGTGGTKNMVVYLNRSGGTDGAVSVQFSTTPSGTATVVDDYAATTVTVSWADGETGSKSVEVSIATDAIGEWDETFDMSISSPTGGVAIGTATSQGTIFDDDKRLGTFSLTSATYSVPEGNSGTTTATITVSRTGSALGFASISYFITPGTATSFFDYSASDGGLTWADGEMGNKTFTVTINGDTTIEPDETISIGIGSGSAGNPPWNAALGTSSAVLTIANDEVGAGSLIFVQTSYSPYNNEAGVSFTYPVQRINGADGVVSVTYTVGAGTATPGTDFTPATGTLTWTNGDTANKEIPITVTGSATGKTIIITLSSPTGGATAGPQATITMLARAPGYVSFSSATASVTEGDSGSKTVTVNALRTGLAGGTVSVQYSTSNGTANAGSDYQAKSGTLTWGDADTTPKAISVTVYGDTSVESDETFTLTFSNPTNGLVIGNGPTSVTATITNDDAAPAVPGSLQFSQATYSTVEGNAGASTATITVTRTLGSTGSVSVAYAAAAGTATAGSDFTTTSGTLTWTDGETASKTISVTVLGDTDVESDETVALTLSTPTGGASLGLSSATLTITNDDAAPGSPGTLQFSQATFTKAEGNAGSSTATITVTRTLGSTGSIGVGYAATPGSAVDGTDFTASMGTLTWADGETASKTFSVVVLGDVDVESDETVTLTLSGATGGAALGLSSAVLSIVNDDATTGGGGGSGGGSGGGGGGGGCGAGGGIALVLACLAVCALRSPGRQRFSAAGR